MATTTQAPVTATCFIGFTKSHLTITSPKGGSVCLNLAKLTNAGLTDSEMNLINEIKGLANEGSDEPWCDLTYPEMKSILSIKDKCDKVTTVPTTADKLTTKTASVVHNGITNHVARHANVQGVNETDRQLNQLQAVIDAADKDYVMLHYDIHAKSVGDPTNVLWGYGFPMTESVFCLPEEALESAGMKDLFAEWDAAQVTYGDVPFAERGANKIRTIAARKMSEKLVQLHTSLITRIASADSSLQEAEKALEEKAANGETVTEKEQEAPAKYHSNCVRSIINEVYKKVQIVVARAEQFDVSGDVEDLKLALIEAQKTQAAAFNALAMARHIKPAKSL